MTKKELRKIYLAQQKSLSQTDRLEKSVLISEHFFGEFDLSQINFLHLFLTIAKNNEIETRFFYEKIRREFPHIRLAVPRICGEILESLEFTQKTEFVENRWQIREPVGDELIAEKLFDAVLVPLLCFDLQGFRVGYGKGFYDRFLLHCRADCKKIGLSFFPPVENFVDIHKFDVKLDYCLTPNKIYKF